MKKLAFQSLLSLAFMACVFTTGFAQADASAKATPVSDKTPGSVAVAITASTTPIDLAKAALAAQGGDKYRNLKSMVLRGSVDLYAPNSTQSIPGGFIWVLAGDKFRLEIDARPAVAFKMIYDGQNSYSSLPNVEIPPLSKLGLPVLAKYDQSGYTVTALPDKKKLRGFRISDADGYVTDFFIDTTTGRVMQFLIPYNGVTNGFEHKKFKEMEGVLVPFEFTQRLEMPQGAFFAEYKVKDAKINNPIDDDVFAIPN